MHQQVHPVPRWASHRVRNSAITLHSTKGCRVTIKAQLTGDTIASACGVFACNSSPVIDLMPSTYRRWLLCAVSCETKAGRCEEGKPSTPHERRYPHQNFGIAHHSEDA